MSRIRFWLITTAVGAGCLFVPVAQSRSQVTVQPINRTPAPSQQPVAETKLLMEGLTSVNMRALGKLLREKPADGDSWVFARGQALLIAETGNLLMIRPPKASGKDDWLGYSSDMRDTADKLARAVAAKDYPKSRASLAALANVCNRCHNTFQVPTRIDPFAE